MRCTIWTVLGLMVSASGWSSHEGPQEGGEPVEGINVVIVEGSGTLQGSVGTQRDFKCPIGQDLDLGHVIEEEDVRTPDQEVAQGRETDLAADVALHLVPDLVHPGGEIAGGLDQDLQIREAPDHAHVREVDHDPRAGQKADLRVVQQVQPRVAPKVNPEADLKPDPKVDPRAARKVVQKADLKAVRKVVLKADLKAVRRANLKVAQKADLKAALRAPL